MPRIGIRRGFLDFKADKRSECPDLPSEIWDAIFLKTDLFTCLKCNSIYAAKQLLRKRSARRDAIAKCCASGDLELLKLIKCHVQKGDMPPVVELAASAGHLHIVKWAVRTEDSGHTSLYGALHYAGKERQVEVIEWLSSCPTDIGDGYKVNGLWAAATAGDLGLVKSLAPYAGRRVLEAMEMAAKAGRQNVLEYLVSGHWRNSFEKNGSARNVINAAAEGGQLQCLKMLYKKKAFRRGFTSEALFHAAENYHLDILKWLHRLPLCLKWPDLLAFRIASKDDIEYLQFLHENYPESLEAVMFNAVTNGRLEVAKWLHGKGFKVAAYDLYAAAKHGSLDLIKWLLENKSNTKKDLEESQDYFLFPLDMAAEGGNLSVVEYLHNEGYQPTKKSLDKAAAGGHLEVVKYLHYASVEGCSVQAMHQASLCGHLEVVEFLHQHRSEGCLPSTLPLTVRNHYGAVAEFLFHNRAECAEAKAIIKARLTPGQSVEDWCDINAPVFPIGPFRPDLEIFPEHLRVWPGFNYRASQA